MNTDAKILSIIGVVSVVIIIGAVVLLGKNSTPPIDVKPSANALQILNREGGHKTATDSAKVNIVEFADFECPACAAAALNVKKIMVDYQGKVSLTFRHFPLPQHKDSMKAAEAAEAAGEQGKFWEMENMLYEKQTEWSEADDPMKYFINYATELGLDVDQFKGEIVSNKFADIIKSDVADGQSLALNHTPTFYINGVELNDYSYEAFKAKIDTELSK